MLYKEGGTGLIRSVVSVANIDAFGGAERYAAFLCATLLEAGHEVYLMTSVTSDALEIEEYFSIKLPGLRFKRVPNFPSFLPREINRLALDIYKSAVLKVMRVDYFFECSYKSETFGLARKNYYICHFPHSLFQNQGKGVGAVYMRLMAKLRQLLFGGGKTFLESYDQILANSEFTRLHIKKRWNIEADLLYPPCSQIGSGFQTKSKKIISVGRFESPVANVPHKGQHHLIEAFAGMSDLHKEGWQLHLAGSCRSESGNRYLHDLQKRSEGLPIIFHPNMSNSSLAELLSESLIYWHAQGYGQDLERFPETQEHFGITTVEAMSAGCIPIVIDSAGPKEVAEKYGGETWKNLEELVEKTVEVASLSDDELLRRQAQIKERASYFSEDRFQERIRNSL